MLNADKDVDLIDRATLRAHLDRCIGLEEALEVIDAAPSIAPKSAPPASGDVEPVGYRWRYVLENGDATEWFYSPTPHVVTQPTDKRAGRECEPLYTRQATQPPADHSRGGDTVAISREAFDFLMGHGPLEGQYFSDDHPGRKGRFWWRAAIRESSSLWDTAPLPESGGGADGLKLEWREGAPPKPWSEEWFIAETTFSDRVVLRALPEEYTYDFKTADDTYIKRDKIVRWMQFPDSQFIAPETPPKSAPGDVAGMLHELDQAIAGKEQSMPVLVRRTLAFNLRDHLLAALTRTEQAESGEELAHAILRVISQHYGHRPDILFDADRPDNVEAFTKAVCAALTADSDAKPQGGEVDRG